MKFCEMRFIHNEIWAFLERNAKRNLVHFKRNTGQGQAMANKGDILEVTPL
jgi:hypothetical protein